MPSREVYKSRGRHWQGQAFAVGATVRSRSWLGQEVAGGSNAPTGPAAQTQSRCKQLIFSIKPNTQKHPWGKLRKRSDETHKAG
eukprot:6210088-Pleurochrysis_carterae.AAC.1